MNKLNFHKLIQGNIHVVKRTHKNHACICSTQKVMYENNLLMTVATFCGLRMRTV